MLLEEQSDLGLHCLTKASKTFQQTTKADAFCCNRYFQGLKKYGELSLSTRLIC